MPREPHATSLLDDAPEFTRQRPGGTFLVIKGPDRGEQVHLGDKLVTFGSAPHCDLVLSDKTVSRRHVEAFLDGNQTIVRDLGSTNGTYIQGSRFKEIAVGFGAEIKLGKTVVKFLPEEEEVEPVETERDHFGQLYGRDPKMRRLYSLLEDIAPNDATVLIEGETGTGKELIAEEVHNHSRRRDGPFVVFDCGAVPHELLESALFGHVRGSFTGAIQDRKGAFAEAHGGTIFLDEIGELAFDLQPSLLRALDKRSVRRVGSNSYDKIDVRVIAATNRDLREEVAKRAFREDLYYRLAVIRVHLPPLRERGRDIDLLVHRFVEVFGAERGLKPSVEDLHRLRSHNWPGNVRELRNVIERSCVLAKGESLALDDALGGDGIGQPALGIRTDLPFKEAKGQLVELFEREYIVDLMKRHRMNLSAAAREAQIDRKHLRELIRKYGLDPRGDLSRDE
ncbi:MAG: sigma 54-dependent Fis family transcriptional regulator [Myxococcales bacterium]|nr:sigma 54-dependent Fis family transcriptional regulator [Myxococcales bacterium]